MRREFNELIVLAESKKKSGGSLNAILKLIQDLTDFEEKIQDCVNSQEMSQNKEKIESFLASIDKMYESLIGMVQVGIKSLRTDRSQVVDEVQGEGENQEVVEKVPVVKKIEKTSPPVMVNAPTIPRM